MYKKLEEIKEKFTLSYVDVGRILGVSQIVIFKIIREKHPEYINSKKPNNRLDTELLESIYDELMPKIKDLEPIKLSQFKHKDKIILAIRNRDYDYVVHIVEQLNKCYSSEKLAQDAIDKI